MNRSSYTFALSLYENGQWDECREFLEEKTSRDITGEENKDCVLLLALLYLQKKNREGLSKLLDHYPFIKEREDFINLFLGNSPKSKNLEEERDPSLVFSKGVFFESKGQREKAKEAYQKSLELDPSFIPSLNNLALIYEKEGEVKEAKRLYEKGLLISKKNPFLNVNLAIFLNRLGSYKKNWDISQNLSQLPQNLLSELIAFFFTRDKRYDLALKVLDKQVSKNEKNSSLWYTRGLVLEKQNYIQQALSSYQKAYQLDFYNKTILKALIQLLLKENKIAEVEEILNIVKEDFPHREDIRFFTAYLEMKRKNWKKAELDLRYLLNHAKPKNLYKEMTQEVVIESLDPIINEDLSESFYEQGLYLLAVLYDQTQRYEESLILLKQLHMEVPFKQIYELSLILMLLKLGNLKEAEEHINILLEEDPNHLMLNLFKVRFYLEKDDIESALDIIELLDQEEEAVQEVNQEILKGFTFKNSQKNISSPLWMIPWPKLKNTLKSYFIDSKDRSYRFFWTIDNKVFFFPSEPGEPLSSQEIFDFYQQTPLNTLGPLHSLYKPLEEGEVFEGNLENKYLLDLDDSLELFIKKANLPESHVPENPTEEELREERTNNEDEQEKKPYSIEDLALLFDSLESSPLIKESLKKKIEDKKNLLIPTISFKNKKDLKDFWESEIGKITL